MKVVVTGASGFLGRALMMRLRESGIKAQGVSRRPLTGLILVKDYRETPTGDVLIHLAEASDRTFAQANSPDYEQQAIATLKALQQKSYSKIIYSSSGLVYGDTEGGVRRVADAVYGTDVYTRLKLDSENLVLSAGGSVARLGNLYGRGMAAGNVMSDILSQLSINGPIRVRDTGPVRDFIWVADAAEALVKMALSSSKGVFNIGSGVGISIGDLALRILALAQQDGRDVESVEPSKITSSLILDISKTKLTLNWSPAVGLTEGLSTLVNKEAG